MTCRDRKDDDDECDDDGDDDDAQMSMMTTVLRKPTAMPRPTGLKRHMKPYGAIRQGGRTTCALQGASTGPPFKIPDRPREQRRSRKMESRQRRITPDLMTLRLSILRPVLVGAPPWHRGRAQPNYQHGDGEDLPTGRGACTPLLVRGGGHKLEVGPLGKDRT